MSDLRGVKIKKGAVGPAVGDFDGISGLLINGPAVAAAGDILGVELATVYELKSVADAEARGIDAAYDSDNDCLTYRHITEFYRMAGEGQSLYIMVCESTKDMATMLADHGEDFLRNADGELRQIMVAYNTPDAYAPTAVDGLEPVVFAAIAAAQTLHDWSFANDMPCQFIVEGRGIEGTSAAIQDLKGIEVSSSVVEYNNVLMFAGQDWDYADSLAGALQKFADVGTLGGLISAVAVNANPGEVGEDTTDNLFNITDVKRSKWLTAGLSSHEKITARDDLQALNDKGYVFAISYTGMSGYRINDDHVCAPQVIDEDDNMNIHTYALGRTFNKLARNVRRVMLPHVKSTVPVDTETGKLPTGIVQYFKGIGDRAYNPMLNAGELSGGETFVDPSSDLLSGDKELVTEITMVPTGIVGEISATLRIKKSLA
jgi:hypothetical protein